MWPKQVNIPFLHSEELEQWHAPLGARGQAELHTYLRVCTEFSTGHLPTKLQLNLANVRNHQSVQLVVNLPFRCMRTVNAGVVTVEVLEARLPPRVSTISRKEKPLHPYAAMVVGSSGTSVE